MPNQTGLYHKSRHLADRQNASVPMRTPQHNRPARIDIHHSLKGDIADIVLPVHSLGLNDQGIIVSGDVMVMNTSNQYPFDWKVAKDGIQHHDG